MPVDYNRGQVKRVSLEILYPSGQLKQVHIAIGGVPKWEGAGMIVWDEGLIREVVVPGLASAFGEQAAKQALSCWENPEPEAKYNGTVLLVREDGGSTAPCGAHGATSHAALWPDVPDLIEWVIDALDRRGQRDTAN